MSGDDIEELRDHRDAIDSLIEVIHRLQDIDRDTTSAAIEVQALINREFEAMDDVLARINNPPEWGIPLTDNVREESIQGLLAEHDAQRLKRLRREMQDLAAETDDECKELLLYYRISLIDDAIERDLAPDQELSEKEERRHTAAVEQLKRMFARYGSHSNVPEAAKNDDVE